MFTTVLNRSMLSRLFDGPTKEKKDSRWRNVRIAVMVAFLISLGFLLLNRGKLPDDWESFIDLSFGMSIGLSLWLSMSNLNSRLAPRMDWLGKPFRSLTIVLVANTVVAGLALAVVRAVYLISYFGQTFREWIAGETIGEYILTILIGLFISAIYQGAYFVALWKESLVQAEQLKTANLAAKYEALNAQINPHFLFNSLNVLSSLVSSNPSGAERFIHGLSAVYRYVLDVRNESLVHLGRELEMLASFGELLETRFGERLVLDLQLTPKPAEHVVPLALQMLVENAVKHNGATRKNPLRITLVRQGQHLVVRNNRVPLYEAVEGKGIGLDNIRERYRLAAGAEIEVIATPESYEVRLPILTN